MVGQLGTEQMSGVAIVNQLIFVYNLAIFGAVSAASIFGAQYFGKGNHEGHMHSFRFKMYATLTVTALTVLLFVTNGTTLISLYLTDTAGSRSDRCGTSVWTGVPWHYDGWTYSICSKSNVFNEYKRDGTNDDSDDRKFCCGWK